jgi:PhnB protein
LGGKDMVGFPLYRGGADNASGVRAWGGGRRRHLAASRRPAAAPDAVSARGPDRRLQLTGAPAPHPGGDVPMTDMPPRAPVKGQLWPYLMVDGARKAAAFYAEAFGAEEVGEMPPGPDGRTMHIHLYLNGASVMLTDPMPEHGHPFDGHRGCTLHLQVDDADAWHDKAVAAGATSRLAPHDSFWGDRYAQVADPFEVVWAFASPKR